LSFNITAAVVGGTAPYVSTWLIDLSGTSLAPAFYLMTAALITLAVVATLTERTGDTLPDVSWQTDVVKDLAGRR
jgi:MHS family proline/betaine transporter-like MFS transporter